MKSMAKDYTVVMSPKFGTNFPEPAAFKRLPVGLLAQPFYGWIRLHNNNEPASAGFSMAQARQISTLKRAI